MTKTAHHSIAFRVWIRLRGLLALVIVLIGILIGLASLILPNDELYKDYIVKFLAKQWGKNVAIEKISGKWQGFGPKFIINGLEIKGDDEVIVQQATLNVNLLKYLWPKGSTGITLGISDVEVDFERKPSGQIVITQEKRKKRNFSQTLENILASGSLSVNNLSLHLTDSVNHLKSQINSKILVQQSDVSRAFSLELDSKELADKFIIKSMTKNSLDFMKQADWYVEAEHLSLHRLGEMLYKDILPPVLMDAQLWFSTKKGNIVKLVAQADLSDKISIDNPSLSGKAQLVYSGDKSNWVAQLSIKDIRTQSLSQDRININISRSGSLLSLDADALDIPLLKAISETLSVSNNLFEGYSIIGKLTDVSVKYDTNLRRLVAGSIHFENLNLEADFGTVTQLSGTISFSEDQIRLLIDSDQGSAELPGYIRGKVEWDKLLLTAQTSMQDENLDFKINSVWCDCRDFILDGSSRIVYDQGLFLDLTYAVYDAKVNQLHKYWPQSVWKPKLLKFLDQALVQGVVENGMIIYHGLVSEYPFSGNEGVFLTRSDLTNATVIYHQDWPVITEFNAIVDTINQQLIVTSQQGKVLAANINQVNAIINNFKAPLLTVDVDASGDDNYLIDFLKQSPMKKGLEILKQDILLKGQQEINVKIELPLQNASAKIEPEGSIVFNKTDFNLGQFQLNQLDGELDFKGFSLTLNDLESNFLNQKVKVSGDIINQPGLPSEIDIVLNGNYDVKNFESILGFSLPAQGQSFWSFTVSNKNSNVIRFKAESNLKGVNLNVPEPFKKSDNQLSPFSLSCDLPCEDEGWDMVYDNKLKSRFKLDATTSELQLDQLIFGEMDSNTEMFGGHLDTVNVDEWIEILAAVKSQGNKKELPFEHMSLHVNKVIFMSRELMQVDFDIINTQEGLLFNIQADAIKGTITIANDIENKGIVVKLDKLHWLQEQTSTMQQHLSEVSSNYPALHVWIGDFIYDGIPLGESSIEVRPVFEGIRVEKFNTHSELMNLNINGIWLRDEGLKGVSKFNIIMTSSDISAFLKTLGFQAPISQADTIVNMQVQWPGFPSQFEIKSISGKMRVEIGKGEVVDAEPGMGRVLGLFSLTNLPRRLILDFKDVFGKGLYFKSMQGDFTILKGDAVTDSFIIDSSGANITVKGKTGLASQDYDQIVTVEPRVGQTLPTIGAITGGAVGAAAGFLVQGMFVKGLKKVGKIIYKVTGSWENPIIELIETEEMLNEK